MPKFYFRRKPKRKTRKRRRINGRKPLSQRQWLSPFGLKSLSSPLPRSYKCMLRYVERNVVLDPGAAGIAAAHFFSLNSLYDPNATGVGHQPLGFDQLMLMYDHYTVIGSRIKVTATNRDSTNSQYVVLKLYDQTGAPSSIEDQIEQGQCKWTTVGVSGSAAATRQLALGCNPSKYFGRSVMQGDKYQGAAASSPTDQVYAGIVVQPTTATDSTDIRCTVEIEYIAVFTERKVLAQS